MAPSFEPSLIGSTSSQNIFRLIIVTNASEMLLFHQFRIKKLSKMDGKHMCSCL